MRIVSLSMLLLCLYVSVSAQRIDSTEVDRSRSGTISFIKLNEADTGRPKMTDAVSFLKRIHNSSANVEFRRLRDHTDNKNYNHQRFEVFYKGVRLEGLHYVVHSKDGLIESSNGEFAEPDQLNVTPVLNEKTAVRQAISGVEAKAFSWKSESDSLYPTGELVIARVANTEKWVLTYKVLVTGNDPFVADYVYVNAASGEVVRREPAMCTVNTPGTAATRYSGSRSMIGDSFNGQFRLRETISGTDIFTLNFNHNWDPNLINFYTDFTDNNNNWTIAEHHNANHDEAALDAHWAAEETEEYFRTVHSRIGLDGNGHRIYCYVHWGVNLQNAGWFSGNRSFFFGDGIAEPYTPLDIVAHEIGHGINYFEGGVGSGGESGAINEGLSDIWGAVLEWHVNAQKNVWLIGEAINTDHRSLSDPKSRLDPDTYGGQYWVPISNCNGNNDSCGIHTNNGVINHWFYLTAQGGSGTNDLNNTYSVNGIGVANAASIVYYAERFYLTPTSNYASTRTAMISAATVLFGANSCEVKAVTDAWYAVGVGAAFSGTLNPQMTGPAEFCSGSGVYNVPQGTVTSWVLNPSNAGTLTGSGNTRTLTKSADAMVTLTANITNACNAGITASAIRTIKLGFPPLSGATISGPNSAAASTPVTVTVTLPAWATGTKQWIVPAGWTILSGQGTNQLGVRTGTSTGTVTFRITSCSTSHDLNKTIIVGGNSVLDAETVNKQPEKYMKVHPNPADSKIYVEVEGEMSADALKNVRLIDVMGRTVKEYRFANATRSRALNVAGLKSGVYMISINNGKTWVSKKVLINH